MDRVLRIIVLASLLAVGLAMAGCSSSPAPAPAQPSQENNLAPDFQLQNLVGETVSLSDLRGRPVMLNFWATWCNPCRIEMPFMQEVFEDEKWTEQGLVILAINVGEPPTKVNQFVEDNGLSFPVLLDTERSVARNYNIRYFPTTFFIDKNGIIKDGKIGAFASKAEMDWRLINSILDNE